MMAQHRLPFGACAAMLALLCALQAWCLWRAPVAWLPGAITVRLAPGESVVLGQRELAAPQADRAHLGLRRDAAGAWWLRNLSAGKQILLQTAAGEQRMGYAEAGAGQSFQVGAARFEVATADGTSIGFTGAGHGWRYDGALLYRDGLAQASCPGAGMAVRAVALWNRWLPQPLTIARPLNFGGNLHCDNRLGLAGVTPGAATLARVDGRLQLAAGNPDGERAPLLLFVHGASAYGASAYDASAYGASAYRASAYGDAAEPRLRELPLDGVQSLVVGHTRFQLAPRAGSLTLLPGRRVTLFAAPDLKLAPAISWQWRQRALWSGAGQLPLCAALGLACGALLAAMTLGRGGPWQARATALAACALLGAGLAALVLQRSGQAPAAACSMVLGGAALWLWLAVPGRPTLAAAAAVLLLAAGLLAQLELGLGGMETSWLRYYQKSAALLAIGASSGVLCRLYWRPVRAVARQRSVEWALALFAAVALAALATQVLWGDETGVFDLQPVELAKLALTALSAHCLALRLGWQDGAAAGRGTRWLRLIAPALLFMALLGLALVQVDDYSPLILLLVWSVAMALAYALAARHLALAAALCCLALAAVGAIVWLRGAGPGALSESGFYADRFLVWLEPAAHPHTGQQLLAGSRAIGAGGWFGADHWLGAASLGQPAGEAMRIPAVQDDFAPSFFIFRHGLAGALLLWAAQAALLAGIARTALQACLAGAAARDFRQAWLWRFRYFALCGGGAFLFGHFLLSWGTNLAIFPIMGQPMSFLSAGGSHLLFFLCPLLVFCALSAPSLEENPSCRSMSSTKS